MRSKAIMPCGLYRHYKGGLYLLLGVGLQTETEQELAVYVSLDGTLPGPRIRCRPLEMFLEYVKYKREWVPRFEYVDNGAAL